MPTRPQLPLAAALVVTSFGFGKIEDECEQLGAAADIPSQPVVHCQAMAMPDYESVSAYLAAQPAEVRRVLAQVRAAIRKALPQARETISYKIPTYEVGGKAAVYFAAWKRHYSVYPISAAIQRTLRAELANADVEKGTVRFAFDAPVPSALIARIAKLRAAELPPPKSPKPAKSAKVAKKPKTKSRRQAK